MIVADPRRTGPARPGSPMRSERVPGTRTMRLCMTRNWTTTTPSCSGWPSGITTPSPSSTTAGRAGFSPSSSRSLWTAPRARRCFRRSSWRYGGVLRPSPRAGGSARAWAVTMARRRAIDRVRSSQAARDREDQWHGYMPDTDLTVQAVEDRLVGQDVRRALDAVGEPQRSTLVMAYFTGLTHTEIARRHRRPRSARSRPGSGTESHDFARRWGRNHDGAGQAPPTGGPP